MLQKRHSQYAEHQGRGDGAKEDEEQLLDCVLCHSLGLEVRGVLGFRLVCLRGMSKRELQAVDFLSLQCNLALQLGDSLVIVLDWLCGARRVL